GAGNLLPQLRPGRDDPWPARRPGSAGDRPLAGRAAAGAWTGSAGVLPARCRRPEAHHGPARRCGRRPGCADRLLGGQRRRYLPGPGWARSSVRVLDLWPAETLIRAESARAGANAGLRFVPAECGLLAAVPLPGLLAFLVAA